MLGVLGAGSAHADPSTQEKALASRLFDDASKLMSDDKAAAACPKFAESERLDPELGTLLHLGECYAKVGKTASAWASFKEAGDIAGQRNDPRTPKIRERIANLEKSLANLVIVVPEGEPGTLEIRQDGAVVGRASWGTSIPIDPGEHKITATAPGTKDREATVTIANRGQTTTVQLPPIEYLPVPVGLAVPGGGAAAQQTNTASSEEARPWFTTHREAVAAVVGGVGLVGIGVGAAFGLMAKSTYDKSASHCNGDHCDTTGHDDRQSAFGKATVSTVAFGVGGAALIGGVVLWLTAPKSHASEQPPATAITPIIGRDIAAISVQRSW